MKNHKLLIAVICIFLGSVCLSMCILRHSEKQSIEIVQDGTILYSFHLNETENRKIQISAPDGGYNLIQIQNGTICISEADCPDQTCVNMGVLKSEHLPIVCLPHKLIVRFAEDPA